MQSRKPARPGRPRKFKTPEDLAKARERFLRVFLRTKGSLYRMSDSLGYGHYMSLYPASASLGMPIAKIRRAYQKGPEALEKFAKGMGIFLWAGKNLGSVGAVPLPPQPSQSKTLKTARMPSAKKLAREAGRFAWQLSVALESTNGNVQKAARRMRMTPEELYAKAQVHGVDINGLAGRAYKGRRRQRMVPEQAVDESSLRSLVMNAVGKGIASLISASTLEGAGEGWLREQHGLLNAEIRQFDAAQPAGSWKSSSALIAKRNELALKRNAFSTMLARLGKHREQKKV